MTYGLSIYFTSWFQPYLWKSSKSTWVCPMVVWLYPLIKTPLPTLVLRLTYHVFCLLFCFVFLFLFLFLFLFVFFLFQQWDYFTHQRRCSGTPDTTDSVVFVLICFVFWKGHSLPKGCDLCNGLINFIRFSSNDICSFGFVFVFVFAFFVLLLFVCLFICLASLCAHVIDF